MRKFKFKSLTMRIWTTFTAVILLITLCLSVIYLYFFRYMDTKAKTQDLVDAHTYIMQSDFSAPMQFEVFRNLRGSSHFTYSSGYVHDAGRPSMGGQQGRMPALNIDSGSPLPQYDHFAVRNQILDFAAPGMYEESFYKNFDGINFIFVITSMDDGAYFISYIPNVYDNSVMYYMLLISGLFILVGFVAARIIANYISRPLAVLENFTTKIAAKIGKNR